MLFYHTRIVKCNCVYGAVIKKLYEDLAYE